jgi:multisubunit Na+/H+ antiporter MnhB subunit
VGALVAIGPILVMVGIGLGIFAIEEDSPGMVFTGLGIAALGMVLTIVAFIVMRVQASKPPANAADTEGPAT